MKIGQPKLSEKETQKRGLSFLQKFHKDVKYKLLIPPPLQKKGGVKKLHCTRRIRLSGENRGPAYL